MTTVDRLWQECRVHWFRTAVFPRRKRAPNFKAAERWAELDAKPSQADRSIYDASDNIDSTEYENIERSIEPSRISQANTKHNTRQQPGNPPPWNNLSICEDNMEEYSPETPHLSPFQSTPSPEDLRISHPSLTREISAIKSGLQRSRGWRL